MDREACHAEAVERMRILGINENYIKLFADYDVMMEYSFPDGAPYILSTPDKEAVRALGESHNLFFYLKIRNYTSLGFEDIYLYVQECPAAWESERKVLAIGRPYAYIYKQYAPEFSKVGIVNVRVRQGGSRCSITQ